MKIKLTESDLTNIVKRIIKESDEELSDFVAEKRKKLIDIRERIIEMDVEDIADNFTIYNEINDIITEMSNYDDANYERYSPSKTLISDCSDLLFEISRISFMYNEAKHIRDNI